LGDAASEDDIVQTVGNVCSNFPKRDKAKCNTFIEQYGNELISTLAEERDPGLACTLLGVCVPA
jgi:hypothetical protein